MTCHPTSFATLLALPFPLLVAACPGGAGQGSPDGELDPPADAGPGQPDTGLVPCTGDSCVTPTPLDGPCDAIASAGDGTVDWRDARCAPRQTRFEGSLARHLTYQDGGETIRSTGASSYDGMGFVVSHHAGGAIVQDGLGGDVTTPVAGPHHFVRRVEWDVSLAAEGIGSGTLHLVTQWFVATGRSHPLYAITYDLGGAPAGVYSGDARAPYGEIRFDGDRGGTVSGVAWGDDYRFVTLGAPLDKQNGWDYTQRNVVPYALEWIDAYDAEMGLVGSEPQARKAAGGYWFYGAWGTRDDDGPMPEDWNWPFQLNQYSFAAGDTTASTRLAWGMNFGAVGDAAYAVLGDDPDDPAPGSPSGYPYQSYATYVVIGRHSAAVVLAQALAVEVATTRTSVSAQAGAVRASGPAGVGRTGERARDPAGYDPILGVWELDAAAGALDATFHVNGGEPLVTPIVVVHGAPAGASVRLAGATAVDGVDLVRSHDAATGTLWLTFLSAWRGDVRVEVSP